MAEYKILIVDDDAAIRFGMRDFLEAHDYLVDETSSCREAEEAFRVFGPDAAVIDYMLPDGDALELLPRLRLSTPPFHCSFLPATVRSISPCAPLEMAPNNS